MAERIAALSGGTAVDGFKNPVSNDELFCVVVDCGGTLRTGLFPKQGIPTVNVLNGGPSGPMAEYCTEETYVSGVKEENIAIVSADRVQGEEEPRSFETAEERAAAAPEPKSESADQEKGKNGFVNFVSDLMIRVGHVIGKIVSMFYEGARQSVDMMLKNVIPFMLFISFMITFITKTGFGNWLANGLTPLTGNIVGLVVLAVIIGIPVLSPLLGPGAVIQSVLGTLIGTMIATGAVSPTLALPALFAISVVDACDFIPVAAALGDAKPETSRIAVPAMLFSRFVTAPVAVLIGYVAGIGLF